MDSEASAHPESNKYQNSVSAADIKGPEDLDSYSSFLPEVPKDNEVIGAGSRYEENIHKTSDYNTTMDLDVANIDKNDNNTWRTTHKEIYEGYFVKVKLFPREFINICKNYPNETQNIPTDTKKNI